LLVKKFLKKGLTTKGWRASPTVAKSYGGHSQRVNMFEKKLFISNKDKRRLVDLILLLAQINSKTRVVKQKTKKKKGGRMPSLLGIWSAKLADLFFSHYCFSFRFI